MASMNEVWVLGLCGGNGIYVRASRLGLDEHDASLGYAISRKITGGLAHGSQQVPNQLYFYRDGDDVLR